MIEQVQYKKVSWKDLTFALFNKFPAYDTFEILRERTVLLNPDNCLKEYFTVRLAVIGASHFVSFEGQHNFFTEVFSCRRHFCTPPIRKLNLIDKIKGLNKAASALVSPSVEYQIWFDSFDQSELTPQSLKNFMLATPESIRLEFPPGENDGVPFTAVGISSNADEILIRSIHGYNHEYRVVLSESRIIPL